MNEASLMHCAKTVRRNGVERACKNEGTRMRNGLLWCAIHEPEYVGTTWNGPQYRRLTKQGGTRTLAVGNVVPDEWAMVEMTWLRDGADAVTLKLRKLN